MKFFMVFGSRLEMTAGQVHYGRPEDRPRALTWDNGPLGVFQAETAELACQAAAKKNGTAGTYFAIEGYPWGLEMNQVAGVKELGADDLFAQPRQLAAGEADPVRIRELERELQVGAE